MANPICTTAELVDDSACYLQSQIPPRAQKALLIYAKALELDAVGGTDYTSELVGDLVNDAPCWLNKDQKMAALINVAFNNAAAAGATVPSGIQDKREAVNCLELLVQQNPDKADAILLLLECRLGVHKAYPQ